MKVSLGLIAILAVSCSTSRQMGEASKFKRIEIGDSHTPAFYYMDYTPSSASRAPASATREDSAASPKEIYFLGLWQQKKKMESLLSISSNDICPAFHHTLLETKKKMATGASALSLNQNWEEVFKRSNPVSDPLMVLPTKSGKDLYSLHAKEGKVNQEAVKETFKNFYERTKSEVGELCDTGSSEGYFVFANMVQYYSNNGFMKSSEALKAVLKLAPVANYYVLQSLSSGPMGAAPGRYEAAVFQKLNATWFQNYLYKVNRAGEDKLTSNTNPNSF